jgi:hypothetical protein
MADTTRVDATVTEEKIILRPEYPVPG